jgi:hypothetical protein
MCIANLSHGQLFIWFCLVSIHVYVKHSFRSTSVSADFHYETSWNGTGTIYNPIMKGSINLLSVNWTFFFLLSVNYKMCYFNLCSGMV